MNRTWGGVIDGLSRLWAADLVKIVVFSVLACFLLIGLLIAVSSWYHGIFP